MRIRHGAAAPGEVFLLTFEGWNLYEKALLQGPWRNLHLWRAGGPGKANFHLGFHRKDHTFAVNRDLKIAQKHVPELLVTLQDVLVARENLV